MRLEYDTSAVKLLECNQVKLFQDECHFLIPENKHNTIFT